MVFLAFLFLLASPFLSSVPLFIFITQTYAQIAEEALAKLSCHQRQEKENLQLFNFALDKSADAIYWFTFDTQFFYVNDAACKLLGYTKQELLSMKLNDIDKDYKKNTPDFLIHIRQKQYVCFESQQTRHDGSTFPVSISASYFCDASKEFICAFGRDITEEKEKRKLIINQNKALKNSLQDKEVLIKEIHHRVKNNLEVISSLLQMQNRRESNEEVKEALAKSQSRIYAIALVHEMLYKNSNSSTINMKSHLEKLSSAMIELYGHNKDISVNLKTETIFLTMDDAVLVALIIHELFLNAIKHAFVGLESGVIDIFIQKNQNETVVFGVKDNGVGMDSTKANTTNSLGCQLIHTITEYQLNGTIETDSTHGFCSSITFTPKKNGNQ